MILWFRKRPLAVSIIGILFVAAGAFGLIYHGPDVGRVDKNQLYVLIVIGLRILAILGGIAALRGLPWARWVLLLWMLYHTALGAFHSLSEAVIHGLLLAGIAYGFSTAKSVEFFRNAKREDQHVQG